MIYHAIKKSSAKTRKSVSERMANVGKKWEITGKNDPE
jgi:hypothetical protein